MNPRNLSLFQTTFNGQNDKKQLKKFPKIHALSIKYKIRKVLTNTNCTIIRKQKAVEYQRQKIIKQLTNLKDNEEYQYEFKLCELWDDNGKIQTLQSDQPDTSSQYYEQMIDQYDRELEQIKNDSKNLTTILQDFEEKGLSLFAELQQTQQIDFFARKKTIQDVNDLYEDGKFKLDKLNQIYEQFYNLSLQPCGICLIQPEIHQIMIFQCGHCVCDTCLENFRTSQRTKNQFRKCPFCRQQIEFFVNEEIIEKK